MQKIYHQGCFDGACFLYSIVNAYSALMKKPIDQSMWEKALKWIPFRDDYISDIGTQRSDDDLNLYKFTISRLLREFHKGTNISITEYPTISGIKQIQRRISKNSVLILNISGEHWVTAVDYDERHLQIVCSFQLVKKENQYQEFFSKSHNRKYNLQKRYGKLRWLYQPSVFCLTNNNA